jgi:hypothetical protein
MGTNFYLRDKSKTCPHCGHNSEGEGRHIGKSSAGWCFSLHVYPDEGINTLDDWKKLMSGPNAEIKDEYGETVTVKAMLSCICERGWPHTQPPPSAEFLMQNHAVMGPKGLLRHRVNCVGHFGTCDYITGEFS